MENSFINRVVEAFRDQSLTVEVISKINELHELDLERIRKELIQEINKVFE